MKFNYVMFSETVTIFSEKIKECNDEQLPEKGVCKDIWIRKRVDVLKNDFMEEINK